MSQRSAAARALTADIEAHGAYYGVVCNAGIARDAAFPAMTGEDWDAVVHTNLDSFYNVLQPLVMPMVRRRAPGRIVTLASVSGIIGNRGQANYSAAKGGIIAATKALAVELAKREITVNCVAPGLIDTDMVDASTPMEKILEVIPMQRIGKPEEVAAAVSFLMSRRRGLRHAPGDRRERRSVLMRRVVVTGMGGVSALGNDWESIEAAFRGGNAAPCAT